MIDNYIKKMDSTKILKKITPKIEQLNTMNNNSNNVSIINPETSSIKQDILFFKNDVLKEIRKFEEKLNKKLTEQALANNTQNENYEKKLDFLSTKLAYISGTISDNSNLSEKFNKFEFFKTKVEDKFFGLTSRLNNFEREIKESIIKIEKIIDENLNYPGILGSNAKFVNLRFFIDFIMNNFNSLHEFRDDIKKLNFFDFQKRTNTNIVELRFLINENNKSTRHLIERNIKDFESKFSNFYSDMKIQFKDNENKNNEFKNQVNDYFDKYENKLNNKFNNLENDFNEKYKETIKEINDLKNEKNKLINDINKLKDDLDKNEKKIKTQNTILEKISDNIKTKKIFDKFTKKTEETNSDNIIDYFTNLRLNKINLIGHSKSFDKLSKKETSYIQNELSPLSTQEGLITDKDQINNLKKYMLRKNLNQYSIFKNAGFQNNYSITNIPDIKFKKVILPQTSVKNNYNEKVLQSTLLNNKKKRIMSNNLLLRKKNYFHKNDNYAFNKNRTANNFYYNKSHKSGKIKSDNIKEIKSYDSPRILSGHPNSKKIVNLNSLIILKEKSKYNLIHSANNFNERKTRSWSLEKKKRVSEKDEITQIGPKNDFEIRKKFKEVLLANVKNLKKYRRIKI